LWQGVSGVNSTGPKKRPSGRRQSATVHQPPHRHVCLWAGQRGGPSQSRHAV